MATSIRVIVQSNELHPVCEHGPALLFESHSNGTFKRFYACSAYRDQSECPLYIQIDGKEPDHFDRDLLLKNAENSMKLCREKSEIMRKVCEQSPKERIYCHNCQTFVNKNHLENHVVQNGVSNEQIERPTTLLRSLSNDKREAQYFFSDTTLNCITISIF